MGGGESLSPRGGRTLKYPPDTLQLWLRVGVGEGVLAAGGWSQLQARNAGEKGAIPEGGAGARRGEVKVDVEG